MLISQDTDYYNSEDETIPDEEYKKTILERDTKSKSMHISPIEGPNINLKCFKKKYSTEEERHFINEKIKIKKKTELCKNWEVYHDCFYKNECSFAHGIEELRQNFNSIGYKTRLCKVFNEKSVCNFGQRCNYRHVIKEERLFTYKFINECNIKDLFFEIGKKDNEFISILQLYKQVLSRRKIIM